MSSTSAVCAAVPLISAARRGGAVPPRGRSALPPAISAANDFCSSVAGASADPASNAACQSITARRAW
jgi:hypothetical protein